jgi:pilus assembly protein FimV
MLVCLPLKKSKGGVVHESKVKTWLAALIVALLPCAAQAAGLGRITVLTSIGQALVAEIELSVTKEELGSLDARLALPDAYQQANLQYNVSLAGARLTVEKRPNGQPYLKLVTTRPVVEPFIDVLIQLTWASGRLSREYTALLDPPGIPPAPPPAPVISAAPKPVPAPQPPVAAEPPAPVAAEPPAPVAAEPPAPVAAEPPAPVAAEPPAPVAAEPQAPVAPEPVAAAPAISTPIASALAVGGQYGPIERGETLGKIARSVKPEGVTLEQMLVALYRSNPEAFIRKNLNLVRAGKILRVPERDEVTAISQGDAVKEYRTHVADWNAYRQRLADAAGTVAVESGSAVSGKIATTVEDQAAGGPPKDVLRLSRGEATGGAGAGKGKPRGTAERIRVLEEEIVARERALADANERIAQLEKTVKDMQKLVELKGAGMAGAQQQAQQAIAPKPVPAKPEGKKLEAVAAAKPEPAQPQAAKPEAPPVAMLEPKKPEATPAPAPKPAPKAKAKAAPPPPPEPGLVDQIIEAAADPLYLGAGGGVIVLGGLALWMARRRRARAEEGDSPPIAPTLSKAAAAAAGAAATNGNTAAAPTAGAPVAAPGDEVDPIAEADVYILYGRDGQAEEILKEALARDPRREDVQLKLLEIYAGRQDKTAFGKLAGDFHRLTGGSGSSWLKAAEMGYALDRANRLYEAGRSAGAATLAAGAGGASDVRFNLGGGPITSTDIALDAGGPGGTGTDSDILDVGAADAAEKAMTPDFTLEVPPAGGHAETDIDLGATPASDSNVIDFQIELPKLDIGPATIAKAADSRADAGLDFKLEVPDLDLGEKARAGTAAGGEKDGHWYDVQTKFDLAKAYQEMGDRAGAREILQEVIQEGDTEQKEKARTLLDSLG